MDSIESEETIDEEWSIQLLEPITVKVLIGWALIGNISVRRLSTATSSQRDAEMDVNTKLSVTAHADNGVEVFDAFVWHSDLDERPRVGTRPGRCEFLPLSVLPDWIAEIATAHTGIELSRE